MPSNLSLRPRGPVPVRGSASAWSMVSSSNPAAMSSFTASPGAARACAFSCRPHTRRNVPRWPAKRTPRSTPFRGATRRSSSWKTIAASHSSTAADWSFGLSGRSPQGPVELLHRGDRGRHVEEDVVALLPLGQLVGEAALPPLVDAVDRGVTGGQQLGAAVDHGLHLRLLEARLEDDHDFVGPHGPMHLPLDRGAGRRGPRRSGAGVDVASTAAMVAGRHPARSGVERQDYAQVPPSTTREPGWIFSRPSPPCGTSSAMR